MASYSILTPSDIAELEGLYGVALTNLSPLYGGMATSSFTADAPSGKVVISILDNQDDAAALRLAQTTDHMWRHQVPTCAVVRQPEGDLLASIRGKSVVIKEFIEGETLDQLPDDLLPAATEMLGRIHSITTDGLEVPVGRRRLSPSLRRLIDDLPNQEHAGWLRRRLDRLAPFFPSHDDPRRNGWTLSHGDFTPSNIVISPSATTAEPTLWTIDWETVTIDDPMLDCGMSALYTCVTDNRISQERLKLFAEGYDRSGRELENDRILPSIEYAAVIVAFHRYRRHNIRFPDPKRKDYYRLMVDFVDQEFPED